MPVSTITIDVHLNEQKVPEKISWRASDSSAEAAQLAKAMMIAFWDGADKSALRIDLWTKDMLVDEMSDFFYQTFSTMGDTYSRATQYQELSNDIKTFAQAFYNKFRALQSKEGKKPHF